MNNVYIFAGAVTTVGVFCALWSAYWTAIRFREERCKRWQVEDRLDNALDRSASLAAQLTNRNAALANRDAAIVWHEAESRRLQNKILKLEAVAMGGDAKCPQCARLRNRIVRFFEQKRKLKEAYVERVMMVSHGQCDPRALVDAERYLLVDDDEQIRTFGEIRDSEINRALNLLKAANVATTEEKESVVGNPEQRAPASGSLPEAQI